MQSDDGFRKSARIPAGTFAAVIGLYLASPKFQGLAACTRANYRKPLRLAQEVPELGLLSVKQVHPPQIQAFLDGFADRPAAQQKAQTAIKAVEKWAIVRGHLTHAISTGTEAPGGDGGYEPWPDELVALAEANCLRPHIARIITLAANTGQRGSDLVKMRWSDIEEYEGRQGINVTQRKTGLRIWIPFTQALQAAIGTWERRPGYLVVKPDGHPLTRPQLSNQWEHERDGNPALAEIKRAGLVLHGLRATACVRLRRAGATVPLITDMVGLSSVMVARYCRLSDQRENAMAAVHILDRTAIEQVQKQRSLKRVISD